jgi:hypothetical protein
VSYNEWNMEYQYGFSFHWNKIKKIILSNILLNKQILVERRKNLNSRQIDELWCFSVQSYEVLLQGAILMQEIARNYAARLIQRSESFCQITLKLALYPNTKRCKNTDY